MMLVYKNTMKFKKKHTHLWPKRHETHVIWALCHRFHHPTLFLSCIMTCRYNKMFVSIQKHEEI